MEDDFDAIAFERALRLLPGVDRDRAEAFLRAYAATANKPHYETDEVGPEAACAVLRRALGDIRDAVGTLTGDDDIRKRLLLLVADIVGWGIGAAGEALETKKDWENAEVRRLENRLSRIDVIRQGMGSVEDVRTRFVPEVMRLTDPADLG